MADVLAAKTLQTAPLSRSAEPVIGGGLVTTLLTLGLLLYLTHIGSDFRPMSLYADYVLPVGALYVGLAAGSGYGLMSYWSGVRIQRRLLITIVVLQLLAYFAAEYIEYVDVLRRAAAAMHVTPKVSAYSPLNFLHYFQYKAESFAWKHEHSEQVGEALGKGGYFFVLLGIAGFVGGGLVAPLICLAVPYCEGCQRYMKTRQLGLIPASLPLRKISKADVAGQQQFRAQMEQAATTGTEHGVALRTAAEAGDLPQFRSVSAAAFGKTREVTKLPVRLKVDLVHCPSCRRGWVRQSALNGQGKQMSKKVLNKVEVEPPFVEPLLQPSAETPKRT